MQDKGDALGRAERVQHHLQRDPDRIRDQRLILGAGLILGRDHRLGQEPIERPLRQWPAGTQQVQPDPPDDRGQPGLQVLDRGHIAAREPQPGLLHGVLGLCQRAEDPVGDPEQSRPPRVKAIG